MVDRVRAQQQPKLTGRVGPVQYAQDGYAEGLHRFSDSMFRMYGKVQDQLDTEAKVDGARRGASGDVQSSLMFQPTIRGQAYTSAAIPAYTQQVESAARARFDELAGKHWRNPLELKTALEAYTAGVLGDAPEELQPGLTSYLQDLARPLVAGANKQMVQHQALAIKADDEANERQFTMDAQTYSRMLLSSDPEVRISAAVALSRLETQMAARYRATVTDSTGREVPVYKPTEAAKAAQSFQLMVAQHSVQGWFDDAPDKLAALREWRKGNLRSPIINEKGEEIGEYDPGRMLLESDKQKLTTWMRSAISTELNLASALDAAERRQMRDRDDNMVQAALLANPLERNAYLDQIIVTSADPKVIQWAQKARAEGFESDTVRDVEVAVLQGIADGRIRSPADLPVDGLSQGDIVKYSSMVIGRENSNHLTNRPDYKDALDLIGLEVAGQTKGSIVAILSGGGKVADEQEVAKLERELLRAAIKAKQDGTEEGFDPVGYAQSLIAQRSERKSQAKAVNVQIRELEEKDTQLRIDLSRRGVTSEADKNKDPRIKAIAEDIRDLRSELQGLNQ